MTTPSTPSVAAMFIITQFLSGNLSACEGNIVPSFLCSPLKALQHMIKIIMGKPAGSFINKHYSDIIASF